jgi:hypothetical protein
MKQAHNLVVEQLISEGHGLHLNLCLSTCELFLCFPFASTMHTFIDMDMIDCLSLIIRLFLCIVLIIAIHAIHNDISFELRVLTYVFKFFPDTFEIGNLNPSTLRS